ncbi:MAG: HEAT repeat domain-containing protein [Proteobacteria bacterium]|nr:HEAT repeat domain-containing protein [Pseudomonadota bacterium]MBU1708424.1 HEAT repeat domain-containing protein [Pseudomonadota bacterium]
MSERSLKRKLFSMLKTHALADILAELGSHPPRDGIHTLFSGICSAAEKVRWHAISAMGVNVARLADQDMEAARVVMRRLIWSMNDESGGIGWGAPEAMAEIISNHNALAEEYIHMPISYMREDGNFQEHPIQQRGVAWAVGRLAQTRLDMVLTKNPVQYLLPYLESADPTVRGFAAWAAGNLKAQPANKFLGKLLADDTIIRLYENGEIRQIPVQELAQNALDQINS